MTVSDFKMEMKGAAKVNISEVDSRPHDFTYIVAEDGSPTFHMFCDEHETWITHRDDGHARNVDPEIVKKLIALCPYTGQE